MEEEEAKDEEDLRSMDLGEAEVAPPRVDFRTTEGVENWSSID